MKYFNLLFFLLLVFAGCSSSEKTNLELSRDINELKSAPAEIFLDDKTFYLEAYIWRDFMPVVDSLDNKGLMASLKIKTADGSEIPASLNVTKLWILNKNSVWETKPVRTNLLTSDVLEIYSSGGPAWDKGTKTDAVVEIKFKNQVKLLGIKNQEVQAVY
jgi:hypothetical protein